VNDEDGISEQIFPHKKRLTAFHILLSASCLTSISRQISDENVNKRNETSISNTLDVLVLHKRWHR